ncbi:apolipoprotein N-acyltransferase [Paraliomyxa miuraensis]|uniref:apolipoprotein N-acyltransferase n=1 Tax=Paraliomyxa miuraensis TaxID=376150 RepID=UPI002259BD0A|nr:apolipoprotein N-acyltransferase [Paraliomyxa miuraensis]MCX4242980.1 apolipoprotein N-acyltransferase [Paraliomyxa miuraensis]
MRARLQSLGVLPLAALSTTASLMMALGAPPRGITWLVWLGFVPLTLVARVAPLRSRGPRRWIRGRIPPVFWLGWCGGLCTGLVGFPWMAETLERFGGLPGWVALVGLLLFSAWTAVPFGLWAWGVARGPSRGAWAIAWPVVLWIGLTTPWPALFPYTPMIGFAEQPLWIQAAELGGVPLVEAQVVLVGVLLADAILLAGPRRARLLRVAVALAIPLVSAGLGHWRLRAIDAELHEARTVRVGVIQPNTALGALDNGDRMRRLRSMSRRAADEGAQVLVWPEAGAFPFRTRRPFVEDFPDPFRSVLRGHGLPTIFGAGSYEPNVRWERNTVYAMAADGTVTGTFDKVILMPFGEYVPLVDPVWAIRHVPSMSHNLAGEGPARFVIEPAARPKEPAPAPFVAGPLICYEDIFPGFARDVATQDGGIDVFVNVTIDTWFGATAEPWEHLALAQFRSVEHRIPMVRSVAAGVSTVVDSGGRVVAHLPARGPTVQSPVPPERLVVDVALPRNTAARPTVFARIGWLLPWSCVLVVLGAVLAAMTRLLYSRRAKTASASVPSTDGTLGPAPATGRDDD